MNPAFPRMQTKECIDPYSVGTDKYPSQYAGCKAKQATAPYQYHTHHEEKIHICHIKLATVISLS
jgi:hypothetical protein